MAAYIIVHDHGCSFCYILVDRSMVVPERKYGYRTGFSASEIHQLFQEQLMDRPVIGPLREDEITDDFPQDHDPDHEAEAITQTSAR